MTVGLARAFGMRRPSRWLCVVAICALLGCGESREAAPAAAPQPRSEEPGIEQPAEEVARTPNLVLITLDTARADALGAYGQQRPTWSSTRR